MLLPGRLAKAMGGHVRGMIRSRRVSNAKLRSHGWAPHYPTAREGVPATLAAIEAGSDGVLTRH